MSMIGHNDCFKHGNDYYKYEINCFKTTEKLKSLDKRQRNAVQEEMSQILKYASGIKEFRKIFGSTPSEVRIQLSQAEQSTTFFKGTKVYQPDLKEKGDMKLLILDIAKKTGIIGDFDLYIRRIDKKEADKIEQEEAKKSEAVTTAKLSLVSVREKIQDYKDKALKAGAAGNFEEAMKWRDLMKEYQLVEQSLTARPDRFSLPTSAATRNLKPAEEKSKTDDYDDESDSDAPNLPENVKRYQELLRKAEEIAFNKSISDENDSESDGI